MKIPFHKISAVGKEEEYLLEAFRSGKWSGRGPKTLALEALLKKTCHTKHAFFVTSGTAALEIGCLLAEIGPGDEVIIPSFGFVSAANAVALRGATPVFADIDKDSWNITLQTVEPLITQNTKAIMPVHYSGSSAGIEELRALCHERNIFLIEDAAQSIGASRNNQPIGSTPWALCFSFHETKNLGTGEGGVICTDSDELASKIEIIIEKGTNRQRFFRGQIDKYTWVEMGSSFIASDLLAAVGLGQVEKIKEVTQRRHAVYNRIKNAIGDFSGQIRWQKILGNIEHNGHVVGFVMEPKLRQEVLDKLRALGVTSQFHYIPLHDAPYAKELGILPKHPLPNTINVSEGLIRLPAYYSMTDEEVDYVISATKQVLLETLKR